MPDRSLLSDLQRHKLAIIRNPCACYTALFMDPDAWPHIQNSTWFYRTPRSFTELGSWLFHKQILIPIYKDYFYSPSPWLVMQKLARLHRLLRFSLETCSVVLNPRRFCRNPYLQNPALLQRNLLGSPQPCPIRESWALLWQDG